MSGILWGLQSRELEHCSHGQGISEGADDRNEGEQEVSKRCSKCWLDDCCLH